VTELELIAWEAIWRTPYIANVADFLEACDLDTQTARQNGDE
jgi:hypothetical protein